ncbi:permease prefix domain 2-containing transporter [Methylomonas sp. MgM2]
MNKTYKPIDDFSIANEVKELIIRTRQIALDDNESFLRRIELMNDVYYDHLLVLIGVLFKRKRINVSAESFYAIAEPPSWAQYLLYLFIPRKNREALLGDLEEDYREVYRKFGKNKAIFFYWSQALRSIWPLLCASALKLIKMVFKGLIQKLSMGQ